MSASTMIPAAESARADAAAAADQSSFAQAFRQTCDALDVIAGNYGPFTLTGVKR